jgi:hypothetical protein
MGLFKKIKKAVKNPVAAVKSVAATAIKNPIRATAAVSTLGLSEVARQAPLVGSLVKQGQAAASELYKSAANVYTGGAYGAATNLGTSLVEKPEVPMALNVGGLLQSAAAIFGGNQNPYFQSVSNVAGLATNFFPQAQAYPVMAKVPQIAGSMGALTARVGGAVGRSFFNKYPNLATAMQMLRNQGRNIKRSQLYSMMKRFGPELLISGGILTAAAVSELMQAGPGTRRMNPGNVKALRRSLRRLESFHGLCQRADKLRRPSRRKSAGKSCGTQFVRQG